MDAFRIDKEGQLWEQWLVDYSRMTGETFVSFDDYKAGLFGTKANLDKEAILLDADKIRAADLEGR